jgi:hypothetical protein
MFGVSLNLMKFPRIAAIRKNLLSHLWSPPDDDAIRKNISQKKN